MTWDALGAVAELIGATGVIISLLYLAAQIKKQTTEAQLAATRDLARLNNEMAESITSDRDALRVYLQGKSDYEALDDEEKLVLGFTLSRGMRLQEQAYLHSKHDSLHASFYESLRARLAEQLAFPGVRRWWELNEHAFSEEFRDYVEREFPG